MGSVGRCVPMLAAVFLTSTGADAWLCELHRLVATLRCAYMLHARFGRMRVVPVLRDDHHTWVKALVLNNHGRHA